MISTEKMLTYMPPKLAAFKKYIEEYECSYFITELGTHNIVFYLEDTGLPYVLLIAKNDSKHAEIYANLMHDRLDRPNSVLNHELISNDMKLFLQVIRKCKKG